MSLKIFGYTLSTIPYSRNVRLRDEHGIVDRNLDHIYEAADELVWRRYPDMDRGSDAAVYLAEMIVDIWENNGYGESE